MPIQIPTVTVTAQVVSSKEIACNQLYIDRLKVETNPQRTQSRMELATTPYEQSDPKDDATRVFAATDTIRTSDLNAALANFSSAGFKTPAQAFGLVLAAQPEIRQYLADRKAEMEETARAELEAKLVYDKAGTDKADPKVIEEARVAWQDDQVRATTARLAYLDPANPRLK